MNVMRLFVVVPRLTLFSDLNPKPLEIIESRWVDQASLTFSMARECLQYLRVQLDPSLNQTGERVQGKPSRMNRIPFEPGEESILAVDQLIYQLLRKQPGEFLLGQLLIRRRRSHDQRAHVVAVFARDLNSNRRRRWALSAPREIRNILGKCPHAWFLLVHDLTPG
jgi:hypothetical protein